MKICMPIKTDNGLGSVVNADFDSTCLYMIFDIEKNEFKVIDDRELFANGQSILSVLINEKVTHIVTRTMKNAAFSVLRKYTSLLILEAVEQLCSENIKLLKNSRLPELSSDKLMKTGSCGGSCDNCNSICS